jgi:hypothetical protein
MSIAGNDQDEELFGPDAPDPSGNARILAGFIALTRYAAYIEQTFPQFFNQKVK